MLNNEISSCRICFDDAFPDNPLITPCNCTGTSKYIHKTCLNVWIASQSSEAQKVVCEVCKSEYKLPTRITTNLTLTQRAFRDPQLACSVCIIFLLFAMCSLSFILVMKNGVISPKKSLVSFVFAILIFSLSTLCFVGITIKLIKKIFYVKPRNIYQVLPFNNESENSSVNHSISLFRIELERNSEENEK